jgi:glycerol-3-phosphate dehydrogenase
LQRDLKAMAERHYDLVVVGGGITGACIMRDAALRGLKVALLEKKDFSHATSSATSKLVHGGLRYLQNLEFGLIRESLRERRIWQRIAPHLVYPLPFLVPIYAPEKSVRLRLDIGLYLYDALSFDRSWLDDPDQRVPGHTRVSRGEVISREPQLASEDLLGALRYHDCQMYAPERLGLECIKDAVAAGSDAANYAEVTAFVRDKGNIVGVEVTDRLSNQSYIVKGRLTVNASGPWADMMLGLAQGGRPSIHLVRSKGIHVITRPLTQTHAVTRMWPGGHVFVLPWRGHSIIGTTDSVFEGAPDAVKVSEADIAEFLAVINRGLPSAKVTRSDVKHAYVGLRPLVDDGSKDSRHSYGASRRSEICDHTSEGAPGLLSAIGGKWTTSRHLAQKLVNIALQKLARKPVDSTTANVALTAGAIGRFSEFRVELRRRHSDLPEAVTDHLARNYGTTIDELIADVGQETALLTEPLSSELPDVAAEIVYAARHEMAETLEDALFRRTGIGTLGPPGGTTVERAAALMAREKGWTSAETQRQIDAAMRRFVIEPARAVP